MGDWNEWNDLQETMETFEPVPNETKAILKNKETITEILNEPNKYVYKTKVNEVNKKITMYSSGGFGNYIVNPIDNTFYNVRVGSKGEDRFFSVRFTAKSFPGKENDTITLYYETPYVYERHHHVTLPLHIIKKWEEKQLNNSGIIGGSSGSPFARFGLDSTEIDHSSSLHHQQPQTIEIK